MLVQVHVLAVAWRFGLHFGAWAPVPLQGAGGAAAGRVAVCGLSLGGGAAAGCRFQTLELGWVAACALELGCWCCSWALAPLEGAAARWALKLGVGAVAWRCYGAAPTRQ